MSDIDDLFDDFEERKTEEREKQERRHEQWEEERERGVGVLTSTIRPVLEEQAEKIRNRGHKVELQEHLEGYEYPRIEMNLTLQSQKSMVPSSLTFWHHIEGKIRAVENIMFSQGGYDTQHNMVSQEEVTEKWVKEQVVSFIRSVLERH